MSIETKLYEMNHDKLRDVAEYMLIKTQMESRSCLSFGNFMKNLRRKFCIGVRRPR